MCGGGSSCPTTLPFYYLTFFSLFHSCLSSLSHLSSFNFHVADLSFCSRMDVFTLPYLCMQVVVQYLSQYADMSRMNKVPYGNPYATLSRHASKTLRSIHVRYESTYVHHPSRSNCRCSSGFPNTYRCLSPSSHHHCEAFCAVWSCPGRDILGCRRCETHT